MAAFPGKHPQGHRYRKYWKEPWTRKARHSRGFRRFCWGQGYVSPHFTRKEWASKDGVDVPKSLMKNAQRQGFRLEQLRHRLGDKPLNGISYYRSPAHNAAVGGASESRHMQADATDFPASLVTLDFRIAVNEIWRKNGIGEYPGGNVHTDARPWTARWTSW
jgi:uncharacterized protein YcbK (DUF882 family)